MNNRLIKSNDAGGGACTNTVDLYNPFPDGGGVALYQLNGDATDVSGNYDGTASNVTYGTGVFGQAGVFNGTSSYITTPLTYNSIVNLNDKTQDFSFSLWMYQSSLPSAGTKNVFAINEHAPTYQYIGLVVNGSNINFVSYPGGASGDVATTTTDLNVWTHIACVRESSTMKIYKNGSLIQSTPMVYPNMSLDSTLRWVFGRRSDGGNDNYFNGSIDQVRIFNRALRPYEVEALYTEEYCTPTIVPSEHFNTVTYIGDGTTNNPITSVGFEPDFVWIKNRDYSGGISHQIFDSVRGDTAGSGGSLSSNNSNAEYFDGTKGVKSFDIDGFTLDGGVNGEYGVNGAPGGTYGSSYVAWNFKAGGAAVENTDGTITSQVSANTEAGFSVVSWTSNDNTADSVGHGLGVTPDVYIVKRRNDTSQWYVLTNVIDGSTDYLLLNGTNAKTDYPYAAATPTTFNAWDWSAGSEMITYCFAEVEGFSNFGSYVGTGTNSNTVVTGFEPAFIMIKQTTAARNWYIMDNKRNPENPKNNLLIPNTSDSEYSGSGDVYIDFLENGFEITSSAGDGINQSGQSYIYMAFAADPTAVEPTLEDSFNTVLYTGDGTSNRTISGYGFDPDFLWMKPRNFAYSNNLYDTVRGDGIRLVTNTTAADQDIQYLKFTTDGFIEDASRNNENGVDYVVWGWKGAEIPAINSNGSIPSVVSANPAAGFSIVSWTTIGHGLESTPSIVIMKSRTNAGDWQVYSSEIGATQKLLLNGTNAATSSGVWGNTSPNENVFTSAFNNLGSVIAYCFAEVAGFSKFGSYTGNASVSGPTVITGFEPAFVMLKSSTRVSGWYIVDNKRNPTNPLNKLLRPDDSGAEITGTGSEYIDFLANGFQLKASSSGLNASGDTYIYMAFANQF
jgi:hypothetical protein